MKLFQQMLVVGASLGLLAPISAQASNIVDLEEMNSYSRSKKNSSRIDNNTFTNKISKSNSSQKKFRRLDSKTFINEVSEDTANLNGSNKVTFDGIITGTSLTAATGDLETVNISFQTSGDITGNDL